MLKAELTGRRNVWKFCDIAELRVDDQYFVLKHIHEGEQLRVLGSHSNLVTRPLYGIGIFIVPKEVADAILNSQKQIIIKYTFEDKEPLIYKVSEANRLKWIEIVKLTRENYMKNQRI